MKMKKLRKAIFPGSFDPFTIGHADAALAASVFHFGEIPVRELKQYLKDEGINVRL